MLPPVTFATVMVSLIAECVGQMVFDRQVMLISPQLLIGLIDRSWYISRDHMLYRSSLILFNILVYTINLK